MSRSARKWLVRSGVALTVLLVALFCSVILILGSESGSRWVLQRVAALTPLDIDADGSAGTILSTLRVPAVDVATEGVAVTVTDIQLEIDWSRTTTRHVAVQELTAHQVQVDTFAEDADMEPKEPVSMPSLPVSISARQLSVNTLRVNNLDMTAITGASIDARAQTFAAAQATVRIAGIDVVATDPSIQVEGDLPVSGSVDWRIVEGPWSGRADISGSLRDLEFAHELAGRYPARTVGTLFLLDREEPTVDAVTTFDTWVYEDWTAAAGTVHVTGTVNDYTAELAADISHAEGLSAAADGAVSGNLQSLRAIDVALDSNLANLRANGEISWAPDLSSNVRVLATGIDPSAFLAIAPGAIDADVRIAATGPESFSLDVTELSGEWNEQPVTAAGRLTRQGNTFDCDGCRFRLGDNRMSMSGQLVRRAMRADLEIDAPMLAQLWPGLRGSMSVRGRLGGTFALPVLSGQATGTDLALDDWSLESFSIRSQASSPESVDLTIEYAGLARAEADLGDADFRLVGDLGMLDVSAAWSLDGYAANTEAQLSIDEEAVSGRIATAEITESFTGTWATVAPFEFVVQPNAVRIEAFAWRNGDAIVASQGVSMLEEQLSIDAALSDFPLSSLKTLLPDVVDVDGYADATVKVNKGDSGWSGAIDWSQRETSVGLRPADDDGIRLELTAVNARINLVDNAAALRADVSEASGLVASLNATLNEISPDAFVEARLRFSGDNWDWVSVLYPEIDNLEGNIASDVIATGRLASPDLNGEVRWRDGALAIPSLNMPLTEIDVTVTGSSAGDMNVLGNASVGQGKIAIDGRIDDVTSATPTFTVGVTGNQADLLNWPDYQVTASPDLTINGSLAGVMVTGNVNVDRAEIQVRDLPEGAVRPSSDVIVTGREQQEQTVTRVSGDVELTLSDQVHVQAFGLDAHVAGQMRFRVPENLEPRGEGELKLVDGIFEAYGQRLEIETGTMVFTGPLDDPLINVRAIRRIDRVDGMVIAGINLSGRAKNLSSSIFSDPSMAEAEALSYLVLGRPLEEASSAEGSSLSNTAYSLGLRQAGLITNQIGQTVGLDELAVTGNNQNTTALVAGKQINSRLYARYAYGVFTKLGQILLRYKLSDSFSIEVGAGETQSMDVLYTIERE